MAHPEDLEKLCQGPKAWNAWRQEDPDHIPDLRDAELTMSQRQFGPGNGGPIDLSDADLQGMVLRNSTLTDASLVRANLVSTDLVQARLDNADLTGADLTDAVLDYSDLTGANLNGAILVGASLVNVTGLTQDQIAQAHGDPSTALPAYLLPPESWFPTLEGGMFEDYDSHIDLSPLSNDPYEVLGVERNATFDEIRASFRSLVKRLHPDLNPDDPVAQERFKRVSVAYRILGDPLKRDRFNRGEIDADGDIRPEFEANKEFRRYAFKFYLAAAASLIMAIGILGSVWYTFWMQDGTSTQIADSGAPKLTERLTARKPDAAPERQFASSPADKPALPSGQIDAVTTAVEAGDNLGKDKDEDAEAKTAASEPLARPGANETASSVLLKASAPVEIDETPADSGEEASVVAEAPDSDESTPQESGAGDSSGSAVAKSTGPASAEQMTVASTKTQSPASPAMPIHETASDLNAAGSALGDEKPSETNRDTYASLGQSEAIEVSQTLSSASSDANAVAGDENNKIATLIKDVKSLVQDDPFDAQTYHPLWPSAHAVVLKSRPHVSPANDGISDIFSDRTISQLRKNTAQPTATDADSLQIPRGKPAGSGVAELEFDFADMNFEVEGLPEMLINPDAAMQFLLEPPEEESLADNAAVEAKTAKRNDAPTVIQSQY